MRADKNLTWVYTEEQAFEDEVLTLARLRGTELGATPVSSGTGAALRMLAAASRAKAVAGWYRGWSLRLVVAFRHGFRRRTNHH